MVTELFFLPCYLPKINQSPFCVHSLFMLTNEKSRAATLVMAIRLSINKDPWLSIPTSLQVWLCLSYYMLPSI